MPIDGYNSPSFKQLLLLSVLLRVALIFYSEWHDSHSVLKYTDVDYRVFTDAARFLLRPSDEAKDGNHAKGPLGSWLSVGNPYNRETYRYTPLLAVLLTPNIWLHMSFGKYLFAACDVLVGVLLYRLLSTSVLPASRARSEEPNESVLMERKAVLYTSLYLLNPLVFTISTRGSSESTLGALVVTTLYFALNERWDAAAVLLGAATHWKIYPVIHAASVAGLFSARAAGLRVTEKESWLKSWLRRLFNAATLRFALISAGTFALLSAAMYLIWGYPFLYETYLYHLHRLDHRHNFSPHFYPIYLTYPSPFSTAPPGALSMWRKAIRSPLTSFAPQMSLALGTGLLFSKRKEHLPFVWFIQTAIFVTFNKVCTSQYFLWYITLLPLILPSLSLSKARGATVIAVWVGTQALWLHTAYQLEFLGENVFRDLWVKSILFMVGNCWIIGELMKGYLCVGGQPHAVKEE